MALKGGCACGVLRYETDAAPFCGTPLTYRNDGYAHELDVQTCTLDDPETAAPRDHAFASQRVSWMRVDDMPAFPRSRGEGMSGLNQKE